MPSKKRKRPWRFEDAQATTPYVRRLLMSLREHYIAAWHYVRLNGHDPACTEYHKNWLHHKDEGTTALKELFRLSLWLYESPIRGIALYPFAVEVQLDDASTADLVAFWVYHDTREQIESFAFAVDIHDNGLFDSERPIPDSLKAGDFFLWKEQAKFPWRAERKHG